jgi:hypothetical protein
LKKIFVSVKPALLAVWLALIFTLYLSPSKYVAGDVLVALMLLGFVTVLGVGKSGVIDGIKHLIPLLLLLLYVIGFDAVNQTISSLDYTTELLMGFVSFLSLYVISRAANAQTFKILMFGVFILPGLVHLAYMWLDIYLAINDGKIHFETSSKQGLLEEIKNVPRVGRRYLSIALVHTLIGCLLVVKMSSDSWLKNMIYALAILATLSLGVLDARSAYASIAAGGILLVIFLAQTGAPFISKIAKGTKLSFKLISMALIISTAFLAYSAGKSRWIAMSYSSQAAINDVASSENDISTRPYVDRNFWDKPILDSRKCYLEGQFRCRVDQSAYLRLAWLIEGANSLVHHPFGIGYSDNYMGRLWGVEGDESKFQRIDSSLARNVVCFGVIGVILYAWFGWAIAGSARIALISTNGIQSQVVILMLMLIFICATRSVFDLMTLGAWRYLMALTGLFYGTLHSISRAVTVSDASR